MAGRPGERRLPGSLTGTLIACVPIVGAVLARLTSDSDRRTVVRWAGLALGLGGVVLLAGPTAHGGDAWAVTEVLLTALGYSIGPLIASRKLREAPSLGVNACCLVKMAHKGLGEPTAAAAVTPVHSCENDT